MTLAVPTADGGGLGREGTGLQSVWVQLLIAVVAGLAIAWVLDWAWLWPQSFAWAQLNEQESAA